MLARHGRHPVRDCERYDLGARGRARLARDVVEGVAAHGRLFRQLLEERLWQVFFGAFAAGHCAGHQFWAAPGSPERPRDEPGPVVAEVYRAIDREIGEMLRLVGEDTRVLVFAPHGMGPLAHASWSLNEILERLGFGAGPARPAREDGLAARVNPWRLLKMGLPSTWQYAVKDRLPSRLQHELLFRWYARGRGYAGRRAFAVPNNEVVGAVRIGVRGRDRGGMVEPGAQYEALCSAIEEALGELTDPESGRSVVREIARLQERFPGPFAEHLPDLAVAWDASFAWRALRSPRLGTLRIRRQDSRSASHTPRSFLLAHGPGVAAGGEIPGRSVLDLAPSVLAAAGVPVPAHFEGNPLPFASEGAGQR